MMRVPNSALWWVVGGAATFLALVLLVPAAQGLFHFAPLRARDMALSLGAGVACMMWFELVKLVKVATGGPQWRSAVAKSLKACWLGL